MSCRDIAWGILGSGFASAPLIELTQHTQIHTNGYRIFVEDSMLLVTPEECTQELHLTQDVRIRAHGHGVCTS